MSEHLYNIHNRRPAKRRSKHNLLPNQFVAYPHTDSAEKIHQLTMPRSGPIPILPAPQVQPYVEYSSFMLSNSLRTSFAPEGMLLPMSRFGTIEPETTFPTQQLTEHDFSFSQSYPYSPGLMAITPRGSTGLYDYHDHSLESPTVFSLFSSQQSWDNQPNEVDKNSNNTSDQ
mmetsp:Transcript_11453/g.14150  ORF Transcript_11453/g.14150 Transcript_11453/m.14150 type:complete len:172 (-) Transcript_11453:553-1068(-)